MIWENRDWQPIPQNENINEEILLEILGSRKPILFIEGEKNSYDHRIYQSIYSDFLVIPRGSCTKVIESTRSLQSLPSLQYIKTNGLIDRDYRTDKEIQALDEQGIKTIEVAEVENLFCVEELVKYIAKVQELDSDEIFDKVKKFIIKEFKNELAGQVSRKASVEIKFKLSLFEDTPKGVNHINSQIKNLLDSINTEEIYNKYHTEFSSYIENNDYTNILKVFNRKSLSGRISEFLGLAKNMYPDFVMRYMNSSHKENIQNILSRYTPQLSST